MALVNKITRNNLEKNTQHKITDCTYSIINDDNETFLQIDTYGSEQRKMHGKKSQSIRFDSNAIEQLKEILQSL